MKHSCSFMDIHVAPQASTSFQILYVKKVLISVVQVLTSHAPYKGIVMRGSGRVDAPFWREHRLLVMHPDMTRLLWLTHKMTDSLVLGQLEIEVSLHTTAMHMCRHRVPYAASSQFRHTHLKLTGRQHLIHQHLVDIALVACLQRSHVSHHSIRLRHLLTGICGMRCCGVEVKEGRLLRTFRRKSHLTVTSSYIKCLLIAQFEALVTNFPPYGRTWNTPCSPRPQQTGVQ